MLLSNEILRDKLHQYINIVEDNKLQAMYVLFENEIEEEIYPAQFAATLDNRYNEYKQDGIVINETNANNRIDSLLHNLKNK